MFHVLMSYLMVKLFKFPEVMYVCSCLNPVSTCYYIFKNDHTILNSGYELLVSHCGIPYFLIITIRSPFSASKQLRN